MSQSSHATRLVESGLRRQLDFSHNSRIEVYEPSESYQPGDGFELTVPDPDTDAPDDEYRAEARDPTDDPTRERAGTESELDRVFLVRDDTGQQWTDFGQSGEAATRIREVRTGNDYVVESVSDRHDGRERLAASEI
jgi:hypothetical protein